jgi:hypothetical protein
VKTYSCNASKNGTIKNVRWHEKQMLLKIEAHAYLYGSDYSMSPYEYFILKAQVQY